MVKINESKIKKEFKTICKILNTEKTSILICAINILLVINGIRQAFWYDCWDLKKSSINNLLDFLNQYKRNGIRFKFDDGNNYIKDNKVIEEGPLIYNIKKLSPKIVNIIENNDLKKIYHYPIFGEILGYNCHLDIYNNELRKKFVPIEYNLYYRKKKITNLYGFFCLKSDILKKKKEIEKIKNDMDNFIKIVNKNYKIDYILPHNDVITPIIQN